MTDGPIFEPKGADGILQVLVLPVRFAWQSFITTRVAFYQACAFAARAHPATGGSRKLSVRGRVLSKPRGLAPGNGNVSGVQPFDDPFDPLTLKVRRRAMPCTANA
jgi:hypothetical protein